MLFSHCPKHFRRSVRGSRDVGIGGSGYGLRQHPLLFASGWFLALVSGGIRWSIPRVPAMSASAVSLCRFACLRGSSRLQWRLTIHPSGQPGAGLVLPTVRSRLPLNSGVRRSKSVPSAGLSRRVFSASANAFSSFSSRFARCRHRRFWRRASAASVAIRKRVVSRLGFRWHPFFQAARSGHFGFGGFGVSVRLPARQLALTVAPNNSFKRTAGCGLGASHRSRPAAA